jgi:peptide/nickel transport system substrate-binding protein
MKKLFFISLTMIIAVILVIGGCSTATSTTTTTTAPPPTSSTTPPPGTSSTPTSTTPSPTTTAPGEQRYGGTLKVILSQGPANIGYFPEQTFQDETYAPTWSDRLFDLDTQGNLVPNLATSYDYPPGEKYIVLHLRPGVKFQDGTAFNAEAVKWTIEGGMATHAMPGGANIASLEVIDPFTLKVNLIERSSMAPYNLWRPTYYSPAAFDQNGKDWAITHSISTAAFRVTEFQPNVVTTMEKWDGFWRTGKPYLDEVELRVVQEPSTSSALIQAGQVDMWLNAAAQEGADLRDQGFTILLGPNVINNIYPDSKNPDSPFANKAVREAIEYAIDRQAVSDALGYGFTQPINQMAPPGTAGYNPDFVGRPYNPEKARQLLQEAGFGNGIKTTLMYVAAGAAKDLAAVVQNYLAEVGIEVELDPADPGRYWGSIFGTGWNGLLLGVSAINPEYAVAWLDHFGRQPLVTFVSLGKTDTYLRSCDAVVNAPDIAALRARTMDMVTQASEDCMAIPLTNTPMIVVVQPWVHTTYTKSVDWTGWYIWDDWVGEK